MRSPVFRGDPARGAWLVTWHAFGRAYHVQPTSYGGFQGTIGHGWGTHGMRARITALALLVHVTHDRALALALALRFRDDVVASLEGEWELPEASVLAWVEQHVSAPTPSLAPSTAQAVPCG